MLNTEGMRPEKKERHSRKIRLWLIAVLGCAVITGLAVLIRYGAELAAEKNTEAKLQAIYHADAATEAKEAGLPAEGGEQTPAPPDAGTAERPAGETAAGRDSVPYDTDTPENPAGETPGPARRQEAETGELYTGKLPAVPYPDNPERAVRNRFSGLLERNPDIVGWLEPGALPEQAVVQRDHIFYMNHDALQKKNSNGAIFMDAAISLETRPYTLLLYGHNMKSGAMFGSLRNYENPVYYRKYPFMTFASLYEEGRYVIFAAGSIGIEANQPDYIDPFMMMSDNAGERREAIRMLRNASAWQCGVDVRPEDQMLILITCVDQDDRRRVVAARRLREGETEEQMMEFITGVTDGQ